MLARQCLLGSVARLALELRHLFPHQLRLLHARDHLLHLIEAWLHHLLHHGVLLLLEHVLLGLQLLLLILMEQLLVISLHLGTLLLRDVDVGVLLEDLSQLLHLHLFVQQGLLLLELALHLLRELALSVEGHAHSIRLHLLEILLLNF